MNGNILDNNLLEFIFRIPSFDDERRYIEFNAFHMYPSRCMVQALH